MTGSTDGIGKGFANELASKGLDICLISRNEGKLKNTAKEIGIIAVTFYFYMHFSEFNKSLTSDP